MKFYKASEITSPKKHLKFISEIDNSKNQEFKIAEVKWNGKTRIGIRWNFNQNNLKNESIKPSVGVPSSRGFPTWFILPNEFLEVLLKNKEYSKKIKTILEIE